MSYPLLPPEVNSVLMHAGAGSGPMLAAATAWYGLANELRTAASSFASVTSGLSGQGGPWQGPSAAAMAAVAAPYRAWLSTAASHSEQAASQATAVAAAYEAAHAAVVPPELVSINRAVAAALANTNFLGLNSPAIAQKEAEYAEMWAQDVTAMGGYHAGASAAWSQLAPIQQLLQCLCHPGKPAPVLPKAPVPLKPPRAPSGS
ncbi:PPE family protein [Mycobacterium sp.]|uniref:PPE family protein n=1 Tax=Mycobacterium sp. TaxID=1785 RepID=UPI003F97001F